MDEALINAGLPVKCRECKKKGVVKPNTDYGGWYKTKILRRYSDKWFCPKHRKLGEEMDKSWKARSATPVLVPETKETEENTIEELYKLLD